MRDTRYTLLIIVILVGVIAFLGFEVYSLSRAQSDTLKTLTSTREEKAALQASTTERITRLEELLRETRTLLEETVAENEDLEENLEEERDRNEEFEEQIERISGEVGTLDKLAKIDEELLQKYSKVYFLNEHYMPDRLAEIDSEYLYNETMPEYIHAEVEPFLTDMLEAAEDDGVDLWVVSGYRSFDEQAALKGDYTVTYGSGANTFSADQGYSEHQLGTAVDFTTSGVNGALEGLEETEAYEWLREHAHEYGFVLSYPEDNQYYIFEPWHWRFVGTELAEDLHDDNKGFYDLEQRELNEYLINIFD